MTLVLQTGRGMGEYVRSSTANPTGVRPWGYKLSGLGCGQCSGKKLGFDPRTRYLSGMGVNLDAGIFKSQADSIAAQLVQLRSAVSATNQQLLASQRAGQDVSEQAAANQQQSDDLESTIQSFTLAYRATYGAVPPGLSGPALIAGGILTAAALAILAAWIISWRNTQQEINQRLQTQANTAQTAASQQIALQNQAAAAYAAGDTATGDALSALAAQAGATAQFNPGSGLPTDWSAWIQNNWGYVAAAGIGFFVLTKVL